MPMKHYSLIACTLTIGILVCGCTYYSPKDTIRSDKYVAILEAYTNKSTLIGNTTYTPVRPLPIPTPVPIYDYDNSRGMMAWDLKHYGITVNDSFKALFCKISYIDSPTTYGPLAMNIAGIYELPYTVENRFTIVNITSNGTIMATCNNQSVSIKPGENYTAILSSVNTTGYYWANKANTSDYDYANMTEMPWPVTNDIIITVTNEGIFNKSILENG